MQAIKVQFIFSNAVLSLCTQTLGKACFVAISNGGCRLLESSTFFQMLNYPFVRRPWGWLVLWPQAMVDAGY